MRKDSGGFELIEDSGVEIYDSVTSNPEVVSLNLLCVCKSDIVTH